MTDTAELIERDKLLKALEEARVPEDYWYLNALLNDDEAILRLVKEYEAQRSRLASLQEEVERLREALTKIVNVRGPGLEAIEDVMAIARSALSPVSEGEG